MGFSALAPWRWPCSAWFCGLAKGRRDPAAFWFGLLCLTFSCGCATRSAPFMGVPFVRRCMRWRMRRPSAAFTVRCGSPLFIPAGFEHQRLNRLIQNVALPSPGHVRRRGSGSSAGAALFPGFMLWYGPLRSRLSDPGRPLSDCCGRLRLCAGKALFMPALMAVTANGVCLLYGAITVGQFRPAVGGWPEEHGLSVWCLPLPR